MSNKRNSYSKYLIPQVFALFLVLFTSTKVDAQIVMSGDSYKLHKFLNKKSMAKDIENAKIRNKSKVIHTKFDLFLNEKDSFIKLNIMADSSDGSLSIKNWNFRITGIAQSSYDYFTGVENIRGAVKSYSATCNCDESEVVFIQRPINFSNPDDIMIMMFYIDSKSKYKVVYFKNDN
jgi:hypothetical protein